MFHESIGKVKGMNARQSEFEKFLAEEVRRYRGMNYPVKAGLLRRILTRRMLCKRIHPNPNDEFCAPDIGPNSSIISKYANAIRVAREQGLKRFFDEPLTIEKMHPDGYMLLNGHHRWAALIRSGEALAPVKIVNLTQAADLKKMAHRAHSNKRLTMDLDEIVFTDGKDGKTEPQRRRWLRKYFPEQLRQGIPIIFHFFRSNGYDIWVYSARYYSTEYIQRFFRQYNLQLDGVVTGLVQHRPGISEVRKEMDQLAKVQYPMTVHVDGKSVLCIDRQRHQFKEYELSGNGDTWAVEVMDSIGDYEKHEKQ